MKSVPTRLDNETYRITSGTADERDVSKAEVLRELVREGMEYDEIKLESVQVTGPIPANEGFNYAEDDLRENAERYIKRFEQWHEINDGADL